MFAPRKSVQAMAAHTTRRRSRDEHLYGPGPKRILALDGGGVRGIISIQFVKRIEDILRARYGGNPDFRLCDYFDLFAGTSTGAIIAAGLAIGKSAAEIEHLYGALAPAVFHGGRTFSLRPRYDSARLQTFLEREFGDIELGSPDIKCGLLIVAKRVDTDSAWILSNNERSKFWNDHAGSGTVGNKRYLLSRVVRASAAAPYFFPPQRIRVRDQAPGIPVDDGLFLDGGVTGHNNPAFAALQLVRMKEHKIEWKLGQDQLLVVSIGTGRWRKRIPADRFESFPALWQTKEALTGLIVETERSALLLMQWLSHSSKPVELNSEILDLKHDLLAGVPLFSFQRYDATLESLALSQAPIGLHVTDRQIAAMQDMTNTKQLKLMKDIGQRAATSSVAPEDFATAFDLPAAETNLDAR